MKGKVHKLSDDIDTDLIIPGKYLILTKPEDLAEHALEGIEKNYANKIKKGDIIVAGKNFGCGSSREHAPIALKAAGITAIVAKSYARIFYRNAINVGLPLIETDKIQDKIIENDIITIDLENAIITDNKNEIYQTKKLPSFMQEILENNGLIEYINNKIEEK
ncbi:MAG: 3-isopropylmalate dehydratase small subunit [Methanobacteriaceae archaeon]|nr:3-isopropylmalate dehydratase small subunit [Methanobacteriaceae archaeon]